MHIKNIRIVTHLIVLITGLFIGFYFGFKKGPEEFLYWDAQYKASLLAFELEALKAGNIDGEIENKERSLNSELADHGRYLNSKYGWLFHHFTGREFDPKYIKKAVEYRLENPYTGEDLSDPKSWKPKTDMNSEFVQQVIEVQKEQQELIKRVTDLYSKKIGITKR